MATHFYQNLDAWQKAMELAEVVYKITDQLPENETYALSNQMRRAAVSIPSNIAEGQKRSSKKETVHFTAIALGSLAELETQLILSERIYKIDINHARELCVDVGKITTGLLRSLKNNE